MRKIITILNLSFLIIITIYYIKLIFDQAGFYVYPLDDSYIHLSIAKHFALDGVWGVTAEKFTSTSSSPLFTFFEAILIKLFGINDNYPLGINFLCMGWLFGIMYRHGEKISGFAFTMVLTGIVWFPPLYVQILTGMEHLLHICLMSSFLLSVYKFIHQQEDKKTLLWLILWAGLSGITRYESLFIIFPACVLLLMSRHYKVSILIGLASLIPIILYGLISIKNGSYFLPNSILLKGNTGNFAPLELIEKCFSNLGKNKHVFWLLVFVLASVIGSIRIRKGNFQDFIKSNFMALVVVFGVLFHSTFAAFGWMFRYEAYLIALSMLALSPFFDSISFTPLKEVLRWQNLAIFLLIPVSFFMHQKFKHSQYVLDRASINIYEQHYQVGKFLNQYYNDAKVVVGDIGAFTYYSDIKILDLFGLGSIEIAELKRSGQFSDYRKQQRFFRNYTHDHGFKLGIIYDKWVHLPAKFVKVGEWKIQDNRVAGGDVVKFFAVGKENQDQLRADLEEFNKVINKNVEVKVFYESE